MSNKNKRKKVGWGGRRVGAGRPIGTGEKVKICVSVKQETWQSDVKRWQRKPSWLVDGLVSRYVETEGGILETAAAI